MLGSLAFCAADEPLEANHVLTADQLFAVKWLTACLLPHCIAHRR